MTYTYCYLCATNKGWPYRDYENSKHLATCQVCGVERACVEAPARACRLGGLDKRWDDEWDNFNQDRAEQRDYDDKMS